MPIQIQESHTTDRLRRAFRFVGRLVPRLDETISPVVITDDLSIGGAPPVAQAYAGVATVAAVVGERAWFQMIVPPGSLFILRRVWVGSDTAGSFTISPSRITGPVATGNLTPRARDTRNQLPPGVTVNTGTHATGFSAAAQLEVPVLPAMREFKLDYRVSVGLAPNAFPGPAGMLWLAHTTSNASFRVAMEWDEWPAAVLTP